MVGRRRAPDAAPTDEYDVTVSSPILETHLTHVVTNRTIVTAVDIVVSTGTPRLEAFQYPTPHSRFGGSPNRPGTPGIGHLEAMEQIWHHHNHPC